MPAHSANLKDVALAAGVSVSTASRALAGKDSISAATRQRVERAAKALNYHPNIQARGLRTARTYTLGLVIPTLLNPYFATMADAVQARATANGLATIITSYSEDSSRLRDAVTTLSQQNVDGMLVVPTADALSLLGTVKAAGTPVVLIDRSLAGSDLPTVVSDPEPGITAAVELLYARGHRRVGYLAGPEELSTGAERRAAFSAAADRVGISSEHVFQGGFEVSQGITGTRELREARCTAVIAGDSMMTLGALEYCHREKVRIGKQLALVGFDDLDYMRVQPTPLSVIDQDVTQLGYRAADALVAALSGMSPPDATLPTRLITRQSTEHYLQEVPR